MDQPTDANVTLPARDQPVSSALPTVTGYELLEELGRGGMGVVYKARQLGLQRIVALKMILAPEHAGETALARFRAEAEAVARLQHPHIVQVFGIGDQDGRPFLALEFCSGGSLEQQLQGTPLPPALAITLLEPLARAVHAAHRAGIIHRDLKPANILLQGKQSADYADSTDKKTDLFSSSVESVKSADHFLPKITDFGLAKRLDAASLNTQTGSILGSPSYMAPEQASGDKKTLGPPADVYALGAILYECLTGRPPFRAATALDTILQVIGTEPVPPSQLQPQLPRDLETICLKCLEKDPARRYPSADELALDIDRFRQGQPIAARPVSRLERGWRWCKRNPTVAMLTAAVVVLLIAGSAISSWLALVAADKAQDAVHQKEIADGKAAGEKAAREDADRALQDTRRALALSNLRLAQVEWREGHVARAHAALDAIPEDQRHWEWRYLKGDFEGGGLTLLGHASAVQGVAFHPGGRLLASAGADGAIKVWDAATGREVQTLTGTPPPVNVVAFHPDGRRLASLGVNDGSVRLWDLDTGELLRCRRLAEDARMTDGGLAFSPDGRLLAVYGAGYWWIWDWGLPTENLRTPPQPGTTQVRGVAFSPDSKLLVTTEFDNVVRVYEAQTGNLVRTLAPLPDPVVGTTFTADNRLFACMTDQGQLRAWEVATWKEAFVYQSSERASSLASSPEGLRLAWGSPSGTVRVLDVTSRQETLTFQGHSGESMGVSFSPDGMRLASCGADGTVKLWDLRSVQDLRGLFSHGVQVWGLAASADGRRLATVGTDGVVTVWDLDTGQELRSFPVSSAQASQTIAFSRDGGRLATAGSDGTVRIWDAATGRRLVWLGEPGPLVTSVAFHPGGKLVAAIDTNGTVRTWDAATGTERFALPGDSSPFGLVLYSPDGRLLLSAGARGILHLWEADSGRPVRTLTGHTDTVQAAAFSPDGRLLATGGGDLAVRLWDVETGQELAILWGHGRIITGVAFCPDEPRLASCAEDGSIRLWDLESHLEVVALPGHPESLSDIVFTADGRLAAVGSDSVVRLWEIIPRPRPLLLRGHHAPVIGLAFSPDDRYLASASSLEVRVWDRHTGALAASFPGPRAYTGPGIGFDARGRLVIGGGEKPRSAQWSARELRTGEVLEEVPPLSGTPSLLARSSDGRTLARAEGEAVLIQELHDPDSHELTRREARARPDPGWQDAEATRHSGAERWFAADFHLRQLERLGYDRPRLPYERGVVRAALGRLDEARADFARAAERFPNAVESWRALALTQLATGRRDEARASCRQLLRRWGQAHEAAALGLFLDPMPQRLPFVATSLCTLKGLVELQDSTRAWTIRTIMLSPKEVVDPASLIPLVKTADPVTRGAVLCRAGKLDEAEKALDQDSSAAGWLYQGLIELASGNKDEARDALAKADKWLAAPDPQTASKTNGEVLTWDDRLEVELLRREVAAALGDKPGNR